MRFSGVITVVALVLGVLETRVDAYLDPGTGSAALQMLVGGLAAGAVAIRMFWVRLRQGVGRFLGRSGSRPHDASNV